ncbi:MAG: 16S rRNA (cytidine(1402)-2'-O)-methyltransferase [Candidatus Obscuribacterales bacterium]
MSGKLFIISTPIGNLGDLSDRARQALSDADLIFAEDTRVTRKLLHHLGLNKELMSCHKFNEKSRLGILRQWQEQEGTLALVSDAGTPLVSDPGALMVGTAIELGYEVVPIPGPTALVQALVASGLPTERFAFEGFLLDKPAALRKQLEELRDDPRTLIFYIAPHDIEKKLATVEAVLGDRRICLARELTKKFEQYIRCSISRVKEHLNDENRRGEFTLVVEGASPRQKGEFDQAAESELREFITSALASGMKVSEIAREGARLFGVKKSEAYRLALELSEVR